MADIIILPGIGNSGDTHWQTLWQQSDPAMRRFAPACWDRPDLADWIAALDREVARSAEPPVLVAHSLACLMVAHARPRVAGAFLVSVPDPASAAFPQEAAGFADPPAVRFAWPSLIVASTNDPFGTEGYMRTRAGQWGSGFVAVGAHGHINGGSGLGDWPAGRNLLHAFHAGLG
jgi:predicted alpha/beta hydrolase family esterase